MAIAPQNAGIPSHITGLSIVAKPKPIQYAVNDIGGVKGAAAARSASSGSNVFGNLGIEGSGFATRNDANPAIGNAAPAVTAATPPPPTFNDLTLADSGFQTGRNLLDRDNTLTTAALRKAWLGHTQSLQDNANAHGALFSGARVQADTNATQDYADAQGRQALNYDKGGHDLYYSVFNRLVNQLGGGLSDGSASQ